MNNTTDNKDLLNIVRLAIKDWKAGKLSDFSCCLAIDLVINPEVLTKRDIEQIRKIIKEEKIEEDAQQISENCKTQALQEEMF